MLNTTRCANCGKAQHAHLKGTECPRLDTHVQIDGATLDRLKRTGHPRLLGNLLAGRAVGFAGVSIATLISWETTGPRIVLDTKQHARVF